MRTRFSKCRRPTSISAAAVLVALAFSHAQARAASHPGLFLTTEEIKAIRAKVPAGESPWKEAYDKMLEDARAALPAGPFSITLNGGPEDGHGYFTERPYCGWKAVDGQEPDCRDGKHNPRADREDYANALKVGRTVRDLGIAYAFTGEERYAAHAVELLRAWCLDPVTRMAPHYTPGNSRIDISVTLPGLFYGADLIWAYPGWRKGEKPAFLDWVKSLAESAKTWQAQNNFENWRTNLIAMAGALLDDQALLSYAFDNYKKIMPDQIGSEGQLVREQRRTTSLGYSLYALNAMTQTAEIARHQGVNLYGYSLPDGRGLKLVLDYHAKYCMDPSKWNLQQDAPIGAPSCALYELAYSQWKEPLYLSAIRKWGRPLEEARIMGPVSLTHSNRWDLALSHR